MLLLGWKVDELSQFLDDIKFSTIKRTQFIENNTTQIKCDLPQFEKRKVHFNDELKYLISKFEKDSMKRYEFHILNFIHPV